MSLNNADLLILKSELTNDPTGLGLTTVAADDVANANKLNEVSESIQVYRASVSANDFSIPVDEWSALNAGQQSWLDNQLADGSVNPAVFATEFNKIFGEQTEARASFEGVATESASRARQLFERYVTITPSDVANARNA